MKIVDPRAVLAARNNADLYQLIFSAHNLNFSIKPYAFIGLDPPPSYYSNLTTLSPTRIEEQLFEIRRLRKLSTSKFGLKDGFSLLDLKSEGFCIRIEAKWVWMDSRKLPNTSCTGWKRIQDVDELSEWEEVWKDCGSPTEHHMFPDSLLTSQKIAFFGQKTKNGFEAGCIANISEDCVGLSNVFTRHDIKSAMMMSAQLAADFGRGKAVVGYDSGLELQTMIEIGFEAIGPLRVWAVEKN